MAGPTAELVTTLRLAGCVFAEEEAELLLRAASGAELDALVARRVAGEPLEYVVGWALFDGHRVAVRPGVFVPRRRTEAMVESALVDARTGRVGAASPPGASSRHSLTVVDLCCGSGAVGLAVVRRLVDAGFQVELHAADVMPEAVATARENLVAMWSGVGLSGVAEVHQGDLFEGLPDRLRGQVDVLLANTPYVPTDEIALMPGEARDHEPRATLDGGPDGLGIARRVVDGAGEWLAPGGSLHIEASERQASTLAAYMEPRGLSARVRGAVVTGRC